MSLDGMDISISYSSSFILEEKQYLLRQFVVNSKLSTGHSIIEHSNMFGQRIVLSINKKKLPAISINDDNIYKEVYTYYEAISISYGARAIKDVTKYIAMDTDCKNFYSERRRLLSLINNDNISIDKKLTYITDLESLIRPVLNTPITIDGYSHMLAEENSLALNKWTNGPYYDISLNIIAYKKLDLGA